MSTREDRAFENMCTAIDMQEMFERISVRNHKSFLMHGAVYKVTRDILHVGDVWAFCLSALELQNAETKRVASSSGSKHLTTTAAGQKRCPLGWRDRRNSWRRRATQRQWPSPRSATCWWGRSFELKVGWTHAVIPCLTRVAGSV